MAASKAKAAAQAVIAPQAIPNDPFPGGSKRAKAQAVWGSRTARKRGKSPRGEYSTSFVDVSCHHPLGEIGRHSLRTPSPIPRQLRLAQMCFQRG